jgi:uncharacterized membrane protein YozB (DUF420 family)
VFELHWKWKIIYQKKRNKKRFAITYNSNILISIFNIFYLIKKGIMSNKEFEEKVLKALGNIESDVS